MSIEGEIIGAEALQSILRQLAQRSENPGPAMKSVAATLLRETERIFAQEGKGVGLDEAWQSLSEVTIHQRALAASGGRQHGKDGRELKRYSQAANGLMKILQRSSKLAASIEASSDSHEARLGTNRVYAKTMFYGAKKGQFGRDGRNHPIPWGDIPARPYFPVKGSSNNYQLTEPAGRAVIENLMDYLKP